MAEEEARKLEDENAELKEQVAQKDRRIEELEARLIGALLRIEELERRQRKDSHNSSKPPSSDGLGRKPRSQRKKSGKSSGGQKGHQGHSFLQMLTPDSVITHRPTRCEQCAYNLQQEVGRVTERRQLHDLPDVRLQVQEHRLEEICCPACQHRNQGRFPLGVDAPAQYGHRVQALAVYSSQFQLLPLERTCEVLTDRARSPLYQAFDETRDGLLFLRDGVADPARV